MFVIDIKFLYPTPKNDELEKEIKDCSKLHCSNIKFSKDGKNIESVLNNQKSNNYLKAGEIITDVIKENLITTNYIERNIDVSIDFETDPVEYVNRNEYIQSIKGSDLSNLIYNALNNGVFFRNAKTRRSFNYWQPLSNAGIPAVPRGDKIHETTFLVHDILHNLIPDLQLSNNNELNKEVYMIHRVIGEGICLILADMYFISKLDSSEKFQYDFNKKNIYQAFKHIKNRNLYNNLKANAIYAVTGNKNGFEPINSDIEKYLEWFRPVYISDLKWTKKNIESISSKYETYSKWLETFKPIINYSYQVPTTGMLIDRLEINEYDSVLDITEKIFDFIYKIYVEPCLFKTNNLNSNIIKQKAQNIFYSFQGRIFFDYDGLNTKEYSKFLEFLNEKKYDLVKKEYDSFVNYLYSNNKISKDDLRLYNDVYPHFNSFFISYDADVVVKDTLEEYSTKIFNDVKRGI